MLRLQVRQVRLAERTADIVQMELDVVALLGVERAEQITSELFAIGTAQPPPPPDSAHGMLAAIVFLDQRAQLRTETVGLMVLRGYSYKNLNRRSDALRVFEALASVGNRDGIRALGDMRDDGLLTLEFPYFEHTEPRICESSGTYVSTEQVFTNNVTHEWNHGLGEIVMALLDTGMELTLLEEHASVPWDPLPGQMVEVGGGEMQLADRPERLPASYTLQARRVP